MVKPIEVVEKTLFGLSARNLHTLYEILAKYPDIETVYIFGSRAKGNFHAGSDIDLAIMNTGLEPKTIHKFLSDCAESSLPFMVDLVDFPSLKNEALRQHIQKAGQRLYPPQ